MTDQRKVRETRRKIELLEVKLAVYYAVRKEMIIEMAGEGMTRREIARHWKISNPRVTSIINEGGAWRGPDGEQA